MSRKDKQHLERLCPFLSIANQSLPSYLGKELKKNNKKNQLALVMNQVNHKLGGDRKIKDSLQKTSHMKVLTFADINAFFKE